MNKITKLIINNLNIADKIAHKEYRKIPKYISFEEIQSAAYTGLTEAANRYDFNRSFFKYAAPRIYGEIKDYLRSLIFLKNHKVNFLETEVEITKYSDDDKFSDLIESLDEESQEILIMRYKKDFPICQIASLIGMSKSKTYTKIRKIIKKLKNKNHG